jgi:hypothetical protein
MSNQDRRPDPDRRRERDPGWAIPFAIGGLMLLIGGLFFYNHGGSPTLVAANKVERPAAPIGPVVPVAPRP